MLPRHHFEFVIQGARSPAQDAIKKSGGVNFPRVARKLIFYGEERTGLRSTSLEVHDDYSTGSSNMLPPIHRQRTQQSLLPRAKTIIVNAEDKATTQRENQQQT